MPRPHWTCINSRELVLRHGGVLFAIADYVGFCESDGVIELTMGTPVSVLPGTIHARDLPSPFFLYCLVSTFTGAQGAFPCCLLDFAPLDVFAPSAMKRSSECSSFNVAGSNAAGSAEQPAHLSSAAGGAERPAHPSSDLENKRQKCEQEDELQTMVVYISFPLKNYKTDAQQQSAMEVIRQATETGADVINLAFARIMDVHALLDAIKTQMESSAERPAFSYRQHGPLITLFF